MPTRNDLTGKDKDRLEVKEWKINFKESSSEIK
jgi:hypothetical protein